MVLGYRAVLISPNAGDFDVTERLDIDDLGSITEALEKDLLQVVISDYDVSLDNHDGFFDEVFEGAANGQTWGFYLERETDVRPPKWDVVFLGSLDFPGSVVFDRSAQKVELAILSVSTLLSDASAEGIKRTYDGNTGSVSSGSAVVTLTSTTNLVVGDSISLVNSSDVTETRVILTIDSSTQVTTTANWTTTFAAGSVAVLETPYYRRLGPDFLAGEIFTAAGVPDTDILLRPVLPRFPALMPLRHDPSLASGAGTIRSIVQQSAKLKVTTSVQRYVADNARDGWAVDTASTDAQGDWWPYMSDEPASIETRAAVLDDGSQAWNHTGTTWYRIAVEFGGGNAFIRLKDKAGTTLATFRTIPDAGAVTVLNLYSLDYLPTVGEVWCSYAFTGPGGITTWDAKFHILGGASGDLDTEFQGSWLRYDFRQDRMFTYSERNTGVVSVDYNLRSWDPATRAQVLALDLSASREKFDVVYLWAAKVLNGYMVIPFKRRFTARVWIVEVQSLTLISDDEIADNVTINSMLSGVYFDPDRQDHVVALYARGTWHAVARSYAGVIPYADFEGKSCADALRELALATCSHGYVDRYNTGRFRSRLVPDPFAPAVEIDTPLAASERPVSDLFRRSITVEGRTEAGDDISVTIGETGDSALRESYSGDLISTAPQARAIGTFYSEVLSRLGKDVDVTIPDDGTILRPLDAVTLDGLSYVVLESEADLSANEQNVKLVQVSA